MKYLTFKIIILALVFCSCNSETIACNKTQSVLNKAEVQNALMKMSEKIISSTNYTFTDTKTGKVYSTLSEISPTTTVKLSSDYCEWQYQNSLICFGMNQLSTIVESVGIKTYTSQKINFLANNYPFFNTQRENGMNTTPYQLFFEMKDLWYCGIAANLVDEYAATKDAKYLPLIQKYENHIFNVQPRQTDGVMIRIDKGRKVVQSDDAYMAVIFLVRMWKQSNDEKYLNEAVNQTILYHKYLFDRKDKLYHHVWYTDENRNGGQYWGRGNGWMLLTLVELLNYLPQNHPKRNEILTYYKQHVEGLTKLQGKDGMWKQVLNVDYSYPESSSSAMFVYCIAKGINKGWLSKNYFNAVEKGWIGLQQRITANNEIEGVCVATHFGDDLDYYLNRPTVNNDRHVLGAFLLAGVEIVDFLN
ncbi:MAG TPA: glycoside hydrolase family 88 protein [Paludibacter sp.]